MQIRLIRYFLALVKERHFARAADACGVTQPTLSAGLTALERQMGKRLVVRDRRFISLTPEGEAMLPWAQQMLAAQEGMNAAVGGVRGPLTGEFRLGAIPAALPWTGRLAQALLAAQPELDLSIRSLTSREIVRALAAFELDGGITYLDHEPPADVIRVPLYAEQYRVLLRRDVAGDRTDISVATAADLPLCLLHQGMQNRRILDARMAERGLILRPRATADSYVALLALVQDGPFATIIPDSYARLLPDLPWASILPFSDPLPSSTVGLVVLDREPVATMACAVLAAARSLA
ncbi:LysR family transcriptional regulator [Sphingobium subterraneum]|uniref:DNA-binding transcriptional LysR family regulator n=1 Tax=Sphingobium subterraneum TaxID=627688 RepID=A0A841J311_9SPHN|nr:LysR family transcriptional regulator [Sphingobium subterraneum]MBB6125144.1 DNA-binding transcriptional LysR family regulator [Sphingobium subterraneum]